MICRFVTNSDTFHLQVVVHCASIWTRKLSIKHLKQRYFTRSVSIFYKQKLPSPDKLLKLPSPFNSEHIFSFLVEFWGTSKVSSSSFCLFKSGLLSWIVYSLKLRSRSTPTMSLSSAADSAGIPIWHLLHFLHSNSIEWQFLQACDFFVSYFVIQFIAKYFEVLSLNSFGSPNYISPSGSYAVVQLLSV